MSVCLQGCDATSPQQATRLCHRLHCVRFAIATGGCVSLHFTVRPRTGDIYAVQEMLGHQNIATTQKYLGVNYQNVRDAVEAMAVNSQLHINDILGSSIKNTSDEALILELALRGYDLTKLQTKNNNELVKLQYFRQLSGNKLKLVYDE